MEMKYKYYCRIIFILVAVFNVVIDIGLMAQSKKNRQFKQEISLRLELSKFSKRSDDFFMHYFIPVHDKVVAYLPDGSPVNLTPADTLIITSVVIGEYKNFSGEWLVQDVNYNNTLFVPFTQNVKDITIQVRSYLRSQRDIRVWQRLLCVMALSIPFLGLCLYVLIKRPADVLLPPGLLRKLAKE